MYAVLRSAEHLDAPVITTFKFKGRTSDKHPLAYGVIGRFGTPASPRTCCSLGSRTMSIWMSRFASVDTVISVDVGRNVCSFGRHFESERRDGRPGRQLGAGQDQQGTERRAVGGSPDLADQLRVLRLPPFVASDSAAYAQLCGALVIRAEHWDELDEVILGALSQEGPSLVPVTCDVDLA